VAKLRSGTEPEVTRNPRREEG